MSGDHCRNGGYPIHCDKCEDSCLTDSELIVALKEERDILKSELVAAEEREKDLKLNLDLEKVAVLQANRKIDDLGKVIGAMRGQVAEALSIMSDGTSYEKMHVSAILNDAIKAAG